MDNELFIDILPQPDDVTCGPTCLHALYRFYDDEIQLQKVIKQTSMLKDGGTLAVFLGTHALARGYKATIYTYNLTIFDPTWFLSKKINLVEKLELQTQAKNNKKIKSATKGYIKFLKNGGKIKHQELNINLIRKYLDKNIPILTGLSATYLYQSAREIMVGKVSEYDDINGVPCGHFVVLCGYDNKKRTVSIADPLMPNPISDKHIYPISITRVINSIMLGILTYDSNLLVIEP